MGGERRRGEEEIKSQEAEERHQKLVNEFRKLGEEYAALQTREMESRECRSVLEGRLEVALKEAEQVRASLALEQKRVIALRGALAETEGSDSGHSGGESESTSGDSSLEQVDLILKAHRRRSKDPD